MSPCNFINDDGSLTTENSFAFPSSPALVSHPHPYHSSHSTSGSRESTGGSRQRSKRLRCNVCTTSYARSSCGPARSGHALSDCCNDDRPKLSCADHQAKLTRHIARVHRIGRTNSWAQHAPGCHSPAVRHLVLKNNLARQCRHLVNQIASPASACESFRVRAGTTFSVRISSLVISNGANHPCFILAVLV